MAIADYQQVWPKNGVRVENVRERRHYFDDEVGFSFNGVKRLTGTYVPVTVAVNGGDEGPYRYDHMLAITYHTDGHDDAELTRYYGKPDYGASVKYPRMSTSPRHDPRGVMTATCLANPRDMSVTAADRFRADEPGSHYAIINNVQSDDLVQAWSTVRTPRRPWRRPPRGQQLV